MLVYSMIEILYVKTGMPLCFLLSYFSFYSERKVPKEPPFKRNLRFLLKISSLHDARRGFATLIAHHTYLHP